MRFKTFFNYSNQCLLICAVGYLPFISSATASPECFKQNNISNERLQSCMTLEGLTSHLKMFQHAADTNKDLPGTRFTGTQGYDTSRDYIVKKMTEAGYKVSLQDVLLDISYFNQAQVFEQKTPVTKTYVDGVDFTPYVNSGSGDITGNVSIPLGDISGCLAQDYNGFTAGNIALVQRDSCDSKVKVEHAVAAGAKAVIIFNNTSGILFSALEPPVSFATTPVIFANDIVGNELKQEIQAGNVPTVHIQLDAIKKRVNSQNIIAESPAGNPNKVIVVGAHLDSSGGNAGMNDNASAVATTLETALLMQKTNPVNKLRFVWWTGEEIGLIGSTYYVDHLSHEEKTKIALYLNYEILGAPNGGRLIMGAVDGITPPGSEKIVSLYRDYFDSQNMKYFVFDPRMGNAVSRSDMFPFMREGIPAGYLVTGAEIPWAPYFSDIFTDLPKRIDGLASHPCYHKSCDKLTQSEGPVYFDPNFDFDLYLQMSKAAAHAIYSFAMKSDPLG